MLAGRAASRRRGSNLNNRKPTSFSLFLNANAKEQRMIVWIRISYGFFCSSVFNFITNLSENSQFIYIKNASHCQAAYCSLLQILCSITKSCVLAVFVIGNENFLIIIKIPSPHANVNVNIINDTMQPKISADIR